ncbi:unnamed protein product [Triticum turgidum subsp. durum]|uniref:Plant heme peroxidase family profile domain-containing protein n=1 Tax=Triticum turgidum subsp. durum TaxID=4567 RepID=A0A9R1RI71_TRITD|nr:unnamed protein product [Triticum turgidum subsp. durum]
MAMGSASCISLVVLVALATAATGQLSSTFYDTSCPRALATIKSGVAAAVSSDPRMGASLLRLHFHDCFVQGCDASVLLSGMEQNAGPNVGSLRGFGVIDSIKTQLESICKQTVSCANGNLANLDTTTPNTFDNAYYTNLLSQKGLLHSDQVLFNNDTTDNTVRNFASNAAAFSSAFTTAMIKMGNIAPLTGTQGQIRLSCSKVNS